MNDQRVRTGFHGVAGVVGEGTYGLLILFALVDTENHERVIGTVVYGLLNVVNVAGPPVVSDVFDVVVFGDGHQKKPLRLVVHEVDDEYAEVIAEDEIVRDPIVVKVDCILEFQRGRLKPGRWNGFGKDGSTLIEDSASDDISSGVQHEVRYTGARSIVWLQFPTRFTGTNPT